MLTWEDSYAIARALMEKYPDFDLQDISLNMIYQWTVELPEFLDDRQLANETILALIYQEWLEEAYSE